MLIVIVDRLRNFPLGPSVKTLRSLAGAGCGQEAIDVYLLPGAHIYMPIHHGRDVEAEGHAGVVTGDILIAIVEFVRDVVRVVGIQNRRPVG